MLPGPLWTRRVVKGYIRNILRSFRQNIQQAVVKSYFVFCRECSTMETSNNSKDSNGNKRDVSKGSEADNKDELISFSELRQHNGPFDAWTLVNDKVLDITEFAKHHPGGKIILLSAGKDATVLFYSYHPRGHALPNANAAFLVGL